jgi:hypothetical protein
MPRHGISLGANFTLRIEYPFKKLPFRLCRVTRLNEFSPIVRLFTLGRVLKITEVAQF